MPVFPAINRWAILDRPSGTGKPGGERRICCIICVRVTRATLKRPCEQILGSLTNHLPSITIADHSLPLRSFGWPGEGQNSVNQELGVLPLEKCHEPSRIPENLQLCRRSAVRVWRGLRQQLRRADRGDGRFPNAAGGPAGTAQSLASVPLSDPRDARRCVGQPGRGRSRGNVQQRRRAEAAIPYAGQLYAAAPERTPADHPSRKRGAPRDLLSFVGRADDLPLR